MRKMGAESIVIEDFENIADIQEDNEIIQEITDLESNHTCKLNAKITRFTFLAKSIASNDDLIKIEEKDFLSTAVLMNIQTDQGYFSYLLRCYVRRPECQYHFLLARKIILKDFQ